MSNKPIFKKDFFGCDIYTRYEGYHNPAYRWNGFAAPSFTKEQVNKMLQEGVYFDGINFVAYWEDDTLVVTEQGYEDEPSKFYPRELNTEDGIMTLYTVDDGWTWDADSDFETPEDLQKFVAHNRITKVPME